MAVAHFAGSFLLSSNDPGVPLRSTPRLYAIAALRGLDANPHKLAFGAFRMLFIAPVSVLLFFIDGLGIGTRGPHNPFDDLPGADPLAVFQDEEPNILFGGMLARTDACLGVEGRPQSASGQTTILTGVNAPATIGYHKQG